MYTTNCILIIVDITILNLFAIGNNLGEKFMIPLIDLHCDTIFALEHGESHGTLIENDGHVDIQRMEAAGKVTTAFALYIPLHLVDSPWEYGQRLHNRFLSEITNAGARIKQITKAEQIGQNPEQGAILSCEEAQILEGKLERIEILASWGVRMSTLTWNHENDLAFPNQLTGGLKKFGFEAIEEMENRNILVDVSHLNDDGFYDLAKIAKKPFIASHSNCRAVTNVSRNLRDDQIRILADHGGVIGLNFCASFLSEDWHNSSVEAMTRHALHLKNIGGSEVLAIGTDFDGIGGNLEISKYSEMPLLWDALKSNGMTDTELEKMWFKNALRVLA